MLLHRQELAEERAFGLIGQMNADEVMKILKVCFGLLCKVMECGSYQNLQCYLYVQQMNLEFWSF